MHCTYSSREIETSGVGSHYDSTYKLNTRVKDNSRKESSEKSIETHKNTRKAVFYICENYSINEIKLLSMRKSPSWHDFLFNVLIFSYFFFSSAAVVTRFLAKMNLSFKSCDMHQSGQINTVSIDLCMCKPFRYPHHPRSTMNNEHRNKFCRIDI